MTSLFDISSVLQRTMKRATASQSRPVISKPWRDGGVYHASIAHVMVDFRGAIAQLGRWFATRGASVCAFAYSRFGYDGLAAWEITAGKELIEKIVAEAGKATQFNPRIRARVRQGEIYTLLDGDVHSIEGGLFDGIGIVDSLFTEMARFGNVSYARGRTVTEQDGRDYFEVMADFDVPRGTSVVPLRAAFDRLERDFGGSLYGPVPKPRLRPFGSHAWAQDTPALGV